MANRDLTYTIGVDASDAATGLRKLETAVRSTMRTVDDTLDDGASAGDKFAASIDEVATKMREDFGSATTAAVELQRALRDAGSNLDVGDALNSLNRMGVSMDEVTVDADKFAASLKQLDDVRLEGVKELDEVAPGLASKLDNVEKSAGSSKSALANMVGNTSQSMGELAGVTGDLGVGIGQIGEYFADAALEGEGLASVFKSFATVAGPMAALAAATALVSSVMASRARASDAEAQQVETLTDAYRSGVDPAQAYADALREIGTVTVGLNRNATSNEQGGIIGFLADLNDKVAGTGIPLLKYADALGLWGEATADLAPLLSKAAISVDQWSAAVMGGQQGFGNMAQALKGTTLSAEEQQTVLDGLADSQTANAESQQNAAAMTEVFGDAAKEAAPTAEELAKAQQDAADAADEHAKAVSATTGELHDMASVFNEMARRENALTNLFNLGNAPAAAASATRDIEESIAGLAEAAKGIKLSDALDPANLKADKLLDALDGLRPQVQAKIAEAFATGGPEAATAAADKYVQSIVEALGGKLSPDKVRELLGIGDLATTLTVAVEQSTLARAKAEIDALVGIGGETPFTAYLKLAVQDDSISAAAAHVLAVWSLQEQGVPVTLEPETDPATIAEANAFLASWVAAHPVEQPITGEASGVQAAAEAAAAQAGKTTGTMPLDADDKDAQAGIKGVADTAAKTKPIIDVSANVTAALVTMAIIQAVATAMAPRVTVTADPNPALATIAYVGQQRPQVPANVYVADYPTAGEIQQMIGRPRIPVDIVVGTSIRITGVRD